MDETLYHHTQIMNGDLLEFGMGKAANPNGPSKTTKEESIVNSESLPFDTKKQIIRIGL